MTNAKKKNKQRKSQLVFVCLFFCLFLHFIIKNKSVFFVLYYTFRTSHRGSINHQSITDKKGNSNLVVSLVFKGYLKSRGGSWVVEGAIGPMDNWDGGVGRQHRTYLRGRESAEGGLSLGFSFLFCFYEEHFVQPHLTTFSTSWTKEEPSVHWKVYFLRLLRRGVQQVPCPSVPPGQLPRHSRRETFSWVWHAA